MPMRALCGLSLLCLGACSVLSTARTRVERVRDDVDLSQVTVVDWNGPEDVRRATAGQHEVLSYPFVRRVIAAQHPVLRRLGLVAEDEPEATLQELVGDDPKLVAAFVVPPRGVVVARPEARRSVDVMSHELGHIASWYRGYWRTAARLVSLRSDGEVDPAFADLDALLGAWALEEGVAEATARAARSMAEHARLPDAAAERDRAQRLPALSPPPVITGPADVIYHDLHVVLGEGETYVVDESLALRMIDLAYGAGLRFVQMGGSDGERPEQTYARLWRGFGGTTRQILTAEPVPPSAMAAAARARSDAQLVGATRVGSFLLLHCLIRGDGTRFAEALELAPRLVDDLVLCWAGDRMRWTTQWPDEDTARTFAAWIATRLPGAAIARDGVTVQASWGEGPAAAPRARG